MNTATITSKMQLTIPINVARTAGVKTGEKVHVATKNGRIILTPAKTLLSELAGSISVPEKFSGKDIDFIIRVAKTAYFKSKK